MKRTKATLAIRTLVKIACYGHDATPGLRIASTHADFLQERGYIKVIRRNGNGRDFTYKITPEGQELVEEMTYILTHGLED